MAADVLKYGIGNSSSTTLSSSVSNSDTSAPLTSDTNFQAQSGEGMVLIDEGQATEEIAYSTGLGGSSLTIPLANRGLEGGSAQAHDAGASVKGILTVGMWNDLIDSITNVLSKATGLLDTTKVVDLTTSQTLTNKVLTNPSIAYFKGWDGWLDANETWTYASATTFTIAGVDVTAKYRKGTRLKMTQTTAKYFVVASSSFSTNTTVTVLVSDEYTIANAAISANFYSYEDCPQGFPTKFTFTPTWTGFTGGSPANKILYQVHSGVIYCQFDTIATATSNSATLDFTIPVAALDTGGYKHFWAHVIDNGSHQTNPGIIGVANSTTAKVGKTQPTASGNAFAGFTTSGTKGVSGEFYYSF